MMALKPFYSTFNGLDDDIREKKELCSIQFPIN